MNHPLHILLAGGGTGGHLFPGLAVARKLVDLVPTARVTFAGSGKRFEWRQVSAAGFEYLALPCRPMSGRPHRAVLSLIENLAGQIAAGRFIEEEAVTAVVALGGYVSVPAARAAARRRLPLILLEQNARPGRATRWLARWADCVCLAFDRTEPRVAARRLLATGNPVRQGFAQDTPRATAARRRLLVLGGTNGARELNQEVPRAFYNIGRQLAGWRIVHQSGEAELLPTRQLYAKLGMTAEVVPFVADMQGALGETGLCVCRAGGTTLAELAAAAVPALLIPYPHATDDHQQANADRFSSSGAAVTLDSRETSGRLDNHLTAALGELVADGCRRAAMSAAMARLARPHAARDVAELVIDLAAGVPHPLPAAA